MTLSAVATLKEYLVEDALLPVVAQSPQLCTTLLINTLCRAFARCATLQPLSEPDWPVWTKAIINEGNFPATQLLRPEKQTGCILLQDHFSLPKAEVLRHYKRAFHGELMTHQTIYESYFADNNVPGFIRDTLWARGQLEDLLRALEALQNPDQTARRDGGPGTIVPIRKSKPS